MEAVDLHLHSTASDGEVSPGDVARRASKAGLAAIALTDHDTLAGVAEAADVGRAVGVRVIAGCEFSVQSWWGELHLLGYFLPHDAPELVELLATQRANRALRGEEIGRRLGDLGAPISLESVLARAGNAPVGRPHIARALVDAGKVPSLNDAFDRYLADGAPAHVAKSLPDVELITSLISRLGGVTSAAHLKERATKKTLRRLQQLGVDAVEVLHPAHDGGTVSRLRALAGELDLLKTGGSDWPGDTGSIGHRRSIGAQRVPAEWLIALERLHLARTAA